MKQKSANTIDRDIGQGSNEQVVAKRLDNNADTEEEMGDTPSGGDRVYYLLYNDRKMLMGKLIPTKPGELVHHHVLHSSERNFEITRVIYCNTSLWEEFDEDIHSVGSYVAWDLRNALVKTTIRQPVEVLEKYWKSIKSDVAHTPLL